MWPCLAAAWAPRSGRAAAKVRWVPGSEKAGLVSESHAFEPGACVSGPGRAGIDVERHLD